MEQRTKRAFFTEEEKHILLAHFEKSPWPAPDLKKRLSLALRKPEPHIANWFKNQRQRIGPKVLRNNPSMAVMPRPLKRFADSQLLALVDVKSLPCEAKRPNLRTQRLNKSLMDDLPLDDSEFWKSNNNENSDLNKTAPCGPVDSHSPLALENVPPPLEPIPMTPLQLEPNFRENLIKSEKSNQEIQPEKNQLRNPNPSAILTNREPERSPLAVEARNSLENAHASQNGCEIYPRRVSPTSSSEDSGIKPTPPKVNRRKKSSPRRWEAPSNSPEKPTPPQSPPIFPEKELPANDLNDYFLSKEEIVGKMQVRIYELESKLKKAEERIAKAEKKRDEAVKGVLDMAQLIVKMQSHVDA